jgi:hypothetical protein
MALRANKKADAQAIADRRIGRTDLPGSLKRYLQDSVRRLK